MVALEFVPSFRLLCVVITQFKTSNYMSPAVPPVASIVRFTSTAMAYHVGIAGMHPLRQGNTPIALPVH